ncbi:YfiR family protein [Sandarakinorhabdus sp. DWP1-3-1]|uniref:YfiR family protein n=1 Tax=Sandarakinorhabdus sp. DWP1-3-1 TaxID=2804627 RepID=UPI003CF0665C
MPLSVQRLAATLLLAACAAAARAEASPAGASLEYAVKANFLVRFVPFVTWPPTAFVAANAPFVICIVGEDPFGSAIDDAARGRAIGPRPIVVRRTASVDAGCHLLYARKSAGPVPASAAALTVCDNPCEGARAMIRFAVRDGRVRFVIDPVAVQASGLTISSKLLGLALPPEPGR